MEFNGVLMLSEIMIKIDKRKTFFGVFLAFDFCRFCLVIRFLYQILYFPILILEKALSISLFNVEC